MPTQPVVISPGSLEPLGKLSPVPECHLHRSIDIYTVNRKSVRGEFLVDFLEQAGWRSLLLLNYSFKPSKAKGLPKYIIAAREEITDSLKLAKAGMVNEMADQNRIGVVKCDVHSDWQFSGSLIGELPVEHADYIRANMPGDIARLMDSMRCQYELMFEENSLSVELLRDVYKFIGQQETAIEFDWNTYEYCLVK